MRFLLPLLALVLVTQGALGEIPARQLVDSRAEVLGTDGVSDRPGHELLIQPAQEFKYPTLIVSLEKSSQSHLRPDGTAGALSSPEEQALIARLEEPCACREPDASAFCARRCQMIGQQRGKLEGYLDKGSRSFVSHILFYGEPEQTHPDVVYSAYVDCPAGTVGTYDCEESPYDNSWQALGRLGSYLQTQIDQQGITHILLFSMGWNTTQAESAESFKEFGQLLSAESRGSAVPFKPLIVGLTWHSGWHWGLGSVPVLKYLPAVFSYGNKAKDSDEIGVTWVNDLLNRTLLPLGAENDVPVVAIGHSFGARLLSRAAASAHLLEAEPPKQLSLLVSLQGAFSANRFLNGRCSGKEGAPYFDLPEKVDRVALVWSRNDRSTPLARLATLATHVGGKPGFRRASAYRDHFDFATWDDLQLTPTPPTGREPEPLCGDQHPSSARVEMIEATSSVRSHGDVVNCKVAALLWHLLEDL